MKYIHVIRHGLDMAYSRNVNQVRSWETATSTSGRANTPDPDCCLEFWVRTNERTISYAEDVLKHRFLLVRFDDLVREPAALISRFLRLSRRERRRREKQQVLRAIPSVPRSLGRYKEQELSKLNPSLVDRVRDFGFDVHDTPGARARISKQANALHPYEEPHWGSPLPLRRSSSSASRVVPILRYPDSMAALKFGSWRTTAVTCVSFAPLAAGDLDHPTLSPDLEHVLYSSSTIRRNTWPPLRPLIRENLYTRERSIVRSVDQSAVHHNTISPLNHELSYMVSGHHGHQQVTELNGKVLTIIFVARAGTRRLLANGVSMSGWADCPERGLAEGESPAQFDRDLHPRRWRPKSDDGDSRAASSPCPVSLRYEGRVAKQRARFGNR